MGYNLEEACKGCPECVQCKLSRAKRKVFYCDSCGKIRHRDKLRQYDHEDICLECYIERMRDEWDDLPEVSDEQDGEDYD